MTIALIIVLGFVFGATLQYARLNRFDTISGLAVLENFAVPKAIAAAIGIGAVLISIEIGLGLASYHTKPILAGGIVLGGLVFGSGMALLGYCPGTLSISLGQGSLDALWGLLGGLLGGWVYTLVLPRIQGLIGANLGTVSLYSAVGSQPVLFYVLVVLAGAAFVGIAFWLHARERGRDLRWLYVGIALAVLNAIIFATAVMDRPIGASTFYPYFSDLLTGTTANEYFTKIQTSGRWEMYFLLGAFASGLVISLIRREFAFTLIHDNWKRFKGSAPGRRIFWASVGGFLLIFGARMAGGCTSGHIVSGGMQLAASSLLFAVFVFAGLLATGRLFYRKA
ncbi:MAG: hypothetical protein OHK0039_43300 [Bacteroidia bacterium]